MIKKRMSETTPQSISILVIEDDPGDFGLIRAHVRLSGLVHGGDEEPVVWAKTLTEGITTARSNKPDVMLLDLSLPDSVGLSTVQAMRAALPGVPIVVLTGHDDRVLAVTALQAGAQDYLVKGQFDHDALGRAVRNALMREALESRLHLFEVALGSTANGIVITDIDAHIQWVNPAFTRLTGVSLEDALGRKPGVLVKSGKHNAVFYRDMWETILSGQTWRGEVVNRRKDGSLYDEELIITPVVDGSGTIRHFVAIKQDITERKHAEYELKKLNETLERRVADRVKELDEVREQLYHVQKMETIGRLAGNIAHDFNNKLMAIMGYANLVEMQLKEGDPAMELIKKQLESVDKARTITQSLLAFSRKQPVTFERVRLNKIVEDLEAFLPSIARESVTYHLEVNTGDSLVMADVGRLEQVLMNMSKNAVDAMPDGGRLTITVGVVDLDTATAQGYGLEKAGPYSSITISDTGNGMSAETLKRIFEPFFTTKDRGKGTGLGLSIAYGIVKQHNGHIAVFSEINKGTTFTIYLPLAQKAVETTEEESIPVTATNSLAGGETLLVAEDEEPVRDMLTRILERHGYKIIAATDGADAIAKFTEHKDTIRMLVFDVMMPNKNGKEAYNAIRQIKPDIKALFLSGYSEDDATNSTILNEGLHFMQKPVSRDKLLRMVHEILHLGPACPV